MSGEKFAVHNWVLCSVMLCLTNIQQKVSVSLSNSNSTESEGNAEFVPSHYIPLLVYLYRETTDCF